MTRYKEYYLEITKQVQFPIALRLSCLDWWLRLCEHTRKSSHLAHTRKSSHLTHTRKSSHCTSHSLVRAAFLGWWWTSSSTPRHSRRISFLLSMCITTRLPLRSTSSHSSISMTRCPSANISQVSISMTRCPSAIISQVSISMTNCTSANISQVSISMTR